MIEVLHAALTIEHASLTDKPLQPFTQELLELHKHVFNDPHSNIVVYDHKHKATRTARHHLLANTILEASVLLPIEGTLNDKSSIHLGIRAAADEMSIDLPVAELPELDLQHDPFADMIADYFRSHVQAPDQRVIMVS